MLAPELQVCVWSCSWVWGACVGCVCGLENGLVESYSVLLREELSSLYGLEERLETARIVFRR